MKTPETSAQQATDTLREARSILQSASTLTKSDVIEGITGAIARAVMLGDPSTEIKGWAEISKLLGHYAPETRKIDITVSQGRLRAKFEQLSDADLLKLVANPVIEGSCQRVEGEE